MHHPWSLSHNPYNVPSPFGPLAISNENICQCLGGQGTNPNNVAKTINGNHYFIYTTGILGIEEDITKAVLGAQVWAERLHHPYLPKVPMVGENNLDNNGCGGDEQKSVKKGGNG